YEQARANRLKPDFEGETLTPSFLGARQVDVDLSEIVPYIDWTFFFSAWELKGRFPAILDDPRHGEAARDLYEHAQKLLQRIVDGKLVRARGVYGFWPACAEGDDIVLYEPDGNPPASARTEGQASSGEGSRQVRSAGASAAAEAPADRRSLGEGWSAPASEIVRFPMLRQQEVIADDKPNRGLADFVAPCQSGIADHVGAFAVTAGIGADVLVRKFEAEHDDYSAIIVKALTDRLAEAFAEYLHARARKDWGIVESFTPEELSAEKFQGIRPAFGYPACPDHSLKPRLFDLLGARAIGMDLTEACAMTPPSS